MRAIKFLVEFTLACFKEFSTILLLTESLKILISFPPETQKKFVNTSPAVIHKVFHTCGKAAKENLSPGISPMGFGGIIATHMGGGNNV
ncbi:MAG: hypothetical protein PHP64_00470 [Actinomycetota bacterium]|nr:hypothetical protein [Actinomycetota bacterium]